MVKVNIIALILFVLIIGGGILETKYINDKFKYYETEVASIAELAGKKEDSGDRLEKLTAEWKNDKQRLHIMIPHNELKDVELIMAESDNLIKGGKYELAEAKLRALQISLEAIPGIISISVGNIF